MFWKFPLSSPGAPTSTTRRETSSRERENCGREMTSNFVDNFDFHAIVGIFYMPQIFPSEGSRRPVSNPRTWVPKASMLPLDHRSRLISSLVNEIRVWSYYSNFNHLSTVRDVIILFFMALQSYVCLGIHTVEVSKSHPRHTTLDRTHLDKW
jgi:hypothetical protein